MAALQLFAVGLAVWWAAMSALTISVLIDSRRRHPRPISRAMVLTVMSGPIFWLQAMLEEIRHALTAQPAAIDPAASDPIKPDYAPGDEVVLFTAPQEKAA